MQYLTERNAFFQRILIDPVSSSARLLWLCLSYLINMRHTDITVQSVPIAISTLRATTALSASTIERARDELKEAGYIHWNAQVGRQSAVYQIISCASQRYDAQNDVQSDAQSEGQTPKKVFARHSEAQSDAQDEAHCEAQHEGQHDVQTDAQSDGIYRVDIDNRLDGYVDDDDLSTTHSDAGAREGYSERQTAALRDDFRSAYRDALGFAATNEEIEGCMRWLNSGIDFELIEEAFKRAARYHALRPFPFAAECIDRWRSNGIATVDEIGADDYEFDALRGRHGKEAQAAAVVKKAKKIKPKDNDSLFDV